MTPAARISAAIEVLDRILDGQPAEQSLLRWSRSSRFAGSGDRAAVRDLVFDALRRRNTLAALGGGLTGRGLMIGALRADGRDPGEMFTGEGHAPDPVRPDELPDGLEASDLPDWVRPLWQRSLGSDADAVEAAMQQRAPVWLRVNPLRATREVAIAALAEEGIETVAEVLPTALRVLSNERKLAQSSAYREGLVELQDLSPQLACAALPVVAGMRVLDYCAGGGGKALAIAGMADGLAIAAHDADPTRMADLPARAKRAGAQVQVLTNARGEFDLVIADVPCSGSGTWRRTPDAKWRLSRQRHSELVELQKQILDRAASHVAAGGHLAYMTCSLFDDENGQQIENFFRNNHFTSIQQSLWTPLTASDGFYLALLRRDA